MLKNKVWGLAIAAMLFASCKEQGPAINFEDIAVDPSDTTYITTDVPTAEPRKVLMEEFTGVMCPNCPDGHLIVNSLLAGPNASQLIAVGLYKTNNPLTAPVFEGGVQKTADDFRTEEAFNIDQTIYGALAGSLPIAGFDRAKLGTAVDKLRDRAKWSADFDTRRAVPTVVNMEATSTYNETDGTIKVKVTSKFTSEFTHNIFLTACVTQDSIIDYQEYTSGIYDHYVHNHVFRGLINANGINGLPLGDALHERGRVYVTTLNYKLSDLKTANPLLDVSKIKPEHCRIVVFLHRYDGESYEVLQACEVHMK